jgi:hypothetical protein
VLDLLPNIGGGRTIGGAWPLLAPPLGSATARANIPTIINYLANIFMRMARKKKSVTTHGHSTSFIAIQEQFKQFGRPATTDWTRHRHRSTAEHRIRRWPGGAFSLLCPYTSYPSARQTILLVKLALIIGARGTDSCFVSGRAARSSSAIWSSSPCLGVVYQGKPPTMTGHLPTDDR